MKLRRLNNQGFAHHFLLAIIVAGVAVGGTYYLISSHADTCDVSGVSGVSGASDPASAASDPTSGVSDPTNNCVGTSDASAPSAPSSPTTPTAPATTISATCTVTGIPSSVHHGDTLKPIFTITNTGNANLIKPLVSGKSTWNSDTWSQQLGVIAAGKSASFTATGFTISQLATLGQTITFTGVGHYADQTGAYVNTPNCIATTTLMAGSTTSTPIKSVTITTGDWNLYTGAATIRDGSNGNVLKFTSVKQFASTSNTAARTQSPKLVSFTNADLGKTVKECVQARAVKQGSTSPALTVESHFLKEYGWTIHPTANYQSYCQIRSIVNKNSATLDYLKTGSATAGTVFVKSVTLELQ